MPATPTGSGKIIAVLIQSVIVQALGLLFFYLLSVRMTTEAFGLLSWANAVSVLLTTVVSFGLEQIVLRRVAAGNNTSGWAATAFLLHSVVSSIVVWGILLLLAALLGAHHAGIAALPLLFLAQCAAQLVVPLKMLLNARSRFMPYALIALISNAGRVGVVMIMLERGQAFTVGAAGIILLLSGFAEVIATALYIRSAGLQPPMRVPLRGYQRLLREAAPQYLSVLFDISLARADWILLGILSTDTATGRYAFAYRAFEMLRIPTVAVGLLLMPRLAPLLSRTDTLEEPTMARIQQFFRLEMAAVSAAMLCFAVLWTPLIGPATHGRYGAVNAPEAALLALCLPLHYGINLMWMLCFNARRYRPITRITLITSLVNLGMNAGLIPLLGATGAALAFLSASAVQAALYFHLVHRSRMMLSPAPLLRMMALAGGCYLLPRLCAPSLGGLSWAAISIAGYAALLLLLRQWRRGDAAFIRQHLGA